MTRWTNGVFLVVLAAVRVEAQSQPALLPSPTGQYNVGRTALQWTDSSRSDPTSPDGHRQLVVWLWYPATKGQKFAEWQPGKWGELFWARLLRSDPPSAEVATQFPVQSIQSHSFA